MGDDATRLGLARPDGREIAMKPLIIVGVEGPIVRRGLERSKQRLTLLRRELMDRQPEHEGNGAG
ncbi:hypothetical protein [Nocardia mangyaensis]|uniref:hypothetical protein n=1 Tax=Nocardia mangyaensis TaxID=2213200 RepID=UPI002676D4FD|nr:hypothetical protein [Nocardia mangyaensis]MDO3651005.1 hypothetical protein [Nocardia mangyaensis]